MHHISWLGRYVQSGILICRKLRLAGHTSSLLVIHLRNSCHFPSSVTNFPRVRSIKWCYPAFANFLCVLRWSVKGSQDVER